MIITRSAPVAQSFSEPAPSSRGPLSSRRVDTPTPLASPAPVGSDATKTLSIPLAREKAPVANGLSLRRFARYGESEGDFSGSNAAATGSGSGSSFASAQDGHVNTFAQNVQRIVEESMAEVARRQRLGPVATKQPFETSNPFHKMQGYKGDKIAKARYITFSVDGKTIVLRRGNLEARGGFTKVYPLLDQEDQSFRLRLVHLDAPRFETSKQAAGKKLMNVTPSDAALQELAAMQAINSPLLPRYQFLLHTGNGPSRVTKLGMVVETYHADLNQLIDWDGSMEIPPAALRHVLRNLSKQLQQLHEAGFVHRDLKPQNIMYRKGGEVVVADYGMAGRMPLPKRERGYGTPGYMPREGYHGHDAETEQALNELYDGRFDVFGLGMIVSALAVPAATYRLPSFQGILEPHRLLLNGETAANNVPMAERVERAFWVQDLYLAWQQSPQDPELGKHIDELRLHFPVALKKVETFHASWQQLDPPLKNLVGDSMLQGLPDRRPSMREVVETLPDLGGSPGSDAVAAADYFDARLAIHMERRASGEGSPANVMAEKDLHVMKKHGPKA